MPSQPQTSSTTVKGKRSRAHSASNPSIPDKRTRVTPSTSCTQLQPVTAGVQPLAAVTATAAGRPATSTAGRSKSSEVVALRQEVSALQAIVHRHESTIATLEQRINDLLSAFGLMSTASTSSTTSAVPVQSSRSNDNGSAAATQPSRSYVQAVVSTTPAVRAIRESVVAAVYVDKAAIDRRSSSFIVSGLPPSTGGASDLTLVADLCHRELGVRPDVVTTKRLGHPRPSMPQPLLVHVRQSDEAQSIIRQAKSLRQSTDNHVKCNVFINANLTKAEAKAAYEIRCRRRQSTANANANASTAVTSVATTSASVTLPHINAQMPMPPPGPSSVLNPTATAYNPPN